MDLSTAMSGCGHGPRISKATDYNTGYVRELQKGYEVESIFIVAGNNKHLGRLSAFCETEHLSRWYCNC